MSIMTCYTSVLLAVFWLRRLGKGIMGFLISYSDPQLSECNINKIVRLVVKQAFYKLLTKLQLPTCNLIAGFSYGPLISKRMTRYFDLHQINKIRNKNTK